ncbi:MAG: hypothetical protein ACLP50_33500 [Solirubrobacteraceae bacterium]
MPAAARLWVTALLAEVVPLAVAIAGFSLGGGAIADTVEVLDVVTASVVVVLTAGALIGTSVATGEVAELVVATKVASVLIGCLVQTTWMIGVW